MPIVKKTLYFCAVFLFVLILPLLSGCADAEDVPPELKQPKSEIVPSQTAPLQKGETQIFEYGELSLEVSNVREIKQASLLDEEEIWEYDLYIVYPGAMVTILNADMMDDAEDGLPHADWAIMTSTYEGIDILDDMEPLEVTQGILGVYDPESSILILGFELYMDSEN